VLEAVESGAVWTAPSRLLAARVAGQFGLVTRAQALGGGLTPKTVECHLSSGRWVRLHPGVYLTTPGRDDWDVRSTAAVLWAGPGAALSGTSAGYAWGLVRAEPQLLEVVVPADRMVRSVPGVDVSRSRYARARVDENAWPHRIGAAHTVFDLARGRPVDRAVTLVARGLDLRLCSTQELVRALSERRRQPGRRVLLEMLRDVEGGAESAAEVRYGRDVERRHGLPRGRRQSPTGAGGRHDVEYEEFGVVVEVDGRMAHEAWVRRQKDGHRDRTALARGRVTVRCFWVDLVPTACALAADVGAVLQSRGWSGRLRRCGPSCTAVRATSLPSVGA
jgi:very-short-patch-repair endonuclease